MGMPTVPGIRLRAASTSRDVVDVDVDADAATYSASKPTL